MMTLTKPVLMLNADYMPMNVISWQKAVTLWFSDKVEIVEEYNDEDITSISFSMKCPAVVRLLTFVNSYNKRRVKFSRINVFNRDDFQCQYCGDEPGVKGLTFDHIKPRSLGGQTNWGNIVSACKPCNYQKADKPLSAVDLVLRKKPREPSVAEYMSFKFLVPKTPEAWKNWLSLNAELRQV